MSKLSERKYYINKLRRRMCISRMQGMRGEKGREVIVEKKKRERGKWAGEVGG